MKKVFGVNEEFPKYCNGNKTNFQSWTGPNTQVRGTILVSVPEVIFQNCYRSIGAAVLLKNV